MQIKSIRDRLQECGALQEHREDWSIVLAKVNQRTETIICDAIHKKCPIGVPYYIVFPLLRPVIWRDGAGFCTHCDTPLPSQYATAINLAARAIKEI